MGGISQIPVSGKVFDAEELTNLVDSSLDFWLTTGRYAEVFEKRFAKVMGVRHAMLCNSGSSANLLAVSTLTSPRLGKRRLREGDEVITVAAGFPTTVNPIYQNRLTPVFVDAAARHLRRRHRRRPRGGRPEDPGDRHGAHARQPVQPRRRHGGRRGARPVGRRRHVRRRRRDVRRQAGRLVRRPRDHELLPRAPHHHGRGRLRARAEEVDAQDRREPPRLGTRLLVRARRGEHVQPPVRLAARRAALRLRPQVHVLAHRVQPEDDRHAGRGRRRAARQAARLHRAPPRELAAAPRRAGRSRGVLRAARADAELGAELVRVPADGRATARRSTATT